MSRTPFIAVLIVAAAWPSPLPCRTLDLANEPASVTLEGRNAHEAFGRAVCLADLDGDGTAELIVGAPGLRSAADTTAVGGVLVFAARDLAAAPVSGPSRPTARRVIEGPRERSGFGSVIAAADLDGDGCDDLIVGAPGDGTGRQIARGSISVYFGCAAAAADAPAPAVVVRGDAEGDRFGTSVLTADIDEDGAPEILISAPGTGGQAGTVFLIDAGALPAPGEAVDASDAARARIEGANPGDALEGLAVADLEGDGVLELFLGAYCADAGDDLVDAGALYGVRVASLPAGGGADVGEIGERIAAGRVPRGFLGRAIQAGDIDSDGIDDLIVSAYAAGADKEDQARGEVYVLFGGTRGDVRDPDLAGPDVPAFAGRRWDLLGLPLLVADLNGDGNDDIVIAAQFADAADDERTRCGRVSLFWGSLRSVMLAKAGAPELADVTILGARELDALGGSLGAADIVGGPATDLIIGAPDANAGDGDVPAAGKVLIVSGELMRP